MNGRHLDELIDAFVDAWRRRGGVASPEQIIDAKQVAVVLLARHRGDVPSSAVRNALAPIFCADPPEQADFYRQFEQLLASELPTAPEQAPGPATAPRRRKDRPGFVRRWRLARYATVAVSFVLLLAVAAVVIDEFLPAPAPGSATGGQAGGGSAGSAVTPVGNTTPPSAAAAGLSPELSFQPPPRPPAPVELLSRDDALAVAFAVWLLAALPLVVGLSVLAKSIAGRRVFLSGDRTRSHPEIRTVPIASSRRGPFAYARLADSVTAMRQVRRRQTRRLDARKTVDRTARAGGYPTLAFETRSRRPGYVLLIERRNAFDFFAHATRALADFLHGAGLEVYAYAFQGRPHRLTPLWRKGRQASYQEILQRYHGDALIVAGDPATIRRGGVSGANAWRPDAAAWSSRGLLTSNACETWDHEEDWFREQRFAVAALDSGGFAGMAEWLAGGADQDGPPRFAWKPDLDQLYPRLLADDPERWLEDFEDAEAPRLLAQLRAYLGDDGVLLFAATVAYPELRWPIATYLNDVLFDDEPDSPGAENRLLRIARLPWCREGRMPAYLRRQVLLLLNAGQREQVQASYYRLLNAAREPSQDGATLDIAEMRAGAMRDFLQQMLSTAPPGPYRDYIFQSVLLDPPGDMLGIEMDRRRARQIGRARWRDALPDIFRLARRTAVATAAAAFIAFVWVKPMATAGLEHYNLLANGSLTARVLYLSEAAATGSGARATEYLAARMRSALEAQGFNVVLEDLSPTGAQLQSLLAQSAQSARQVQRNVAVPAGPPDPLAAAIVPNLVLYDANAGVSMLGERALVPDRQASWLASLSTPLVDFASVIATRLDHETYGQPIVTATKAIDLQTIYGGTEESAIITDLLGPLANNLFQLGSEPNEILVLLAEDTRAFQDRLVKGGLGPVMTLVPAGVLASRPAAQAEQMKQAAAPESVVFARPFAIGKYEVTVGEYARFRQSTDPNASAAVDRSLADLPVTGISKSEAVAYADWLSDMTGMTYRLPSDAEWEYAARAGLPAPDATTVAEILVDNYTGSADEPRPVGRLQPNAWGLHDVQWNVSEWVSDCFEPGQVDRGNDCLADAARSGSWQGADEAADTATRLSAEPGSSASTIGFRVLRELPEPRRREPGRSLTVDPGYEQAGEAAEDAAQETSNE